MTTRTTIAALAAMLMLAPAAVRTQAPNFVLLSIDAPVAGANGARRVQYGTLYLSGWAFDCESGEIPPFISIGFTNLTAHTFDAPAFAVSQVYRPDVAAAFSGACPNITSTSAGFWIDVDPQPAPGVYVMHVAMSNGIDPAVVDTSIIIIE